VGVAAAGIVVAAAAAGLLVVARDQPPAPAPAPAGAPSPVTAGPGGAPSPLPSPAPPTPMPSPSFDPWVIAQPTSQQPLTILDIGDSLGEDLGIGLELTLGSNPDVDLIPASRGDTGLSRPDYYDWPAVLEQDLQIHQPGLVVVMLGANDIQSANSDGYIYPSAGWMAVYTQRVDLMMQEAVNAGAHVLWVGMPVMQDPGFSQEMAGLNAIYAGQAALHPGVHYLSAWSVLSTPSGAYAAELPDSGRTVVARGPDGIHIATGGALLLAQAVVAAVDADWGITI
jgi:hypothetical protein